jgi:hypothetical protein
MGTIEKARNGHTTSRNASTSMGGGGGVGLVVQCVLVFNLSSFGSSKLRVVDDARRTRHDFKN